MSLPIHDLKPAIVRRPLVVSPKASVKDVIALMSGVQSAGNDSPINDERQESPYNEVRSSCAIVVDDSQVVGIFTERDVVHLTGKSQALERAPIWEVMSSPVLTLRESTLGGIFHFVSLFQQHNLRYLPILNDRDEVSGLVAYDNQQQVLRSLDLLRLRSIEEVAIRTVVCAESGTTMQAVARQMNDGRVSSVVIVKPALSPNGQSIPLGIVFARDLVRLHAQGLDLGSYTAEAVMSAAVTIGPHESLSGALEHMDRHRTHRLLVTGAQGELLGILTQTSLLQAINPLALYNLAGALEARVKRLEAEKIALHEGSTVKLEQQIAIRTAALKDKAEQEALLRDLATKIRSSLSLQSILTTTVEQVRQVLGCDRVSIWKFEDDWQTVAVAESTLLPTSLMGKRVDDTYANPEHVNIFRQGYIRVVSDIYTTEMSDCHRDMLMYLQTRAKILVPLLCGDRLWGLLKASESDSPRHWTNEEVELMQALSVQLAIALQQATTHEQLQQELKERKQAEAALKTSEARWQFALEGARDGVWDWDTQTNTVFYSHQWKAMLGYAERDVRDGLDEWDSRVHPDDKEHCYVELNDHLHGKIPFYQSEHQLRCKDGSYKWVLTRGQVVERDGDGKPLRVIGTHADISERKQAEDALQMSEARFRAIFESAAIGIAIAYAPDYKLVLTNPAFCSLVGYSPDDLAQLTGADLTVLEDRATEQDLLDDCYRGKRDTYQIEKRLVCQSGQIIWGNLVSSFIRNPDGHIQFGIITVEDITERKRAVDLELSRNRDLREAIFAESTDALFLVDALTWAVFDCNQQAVALFEANSKESLLSKHHHLQKQHQLLKNESESIRALLERDGVWSKELEFVTDRGNSFWGWLSAKQIRVADSAMYLVQIADISIRKRVELDMSRNLEELKRLNTIKDDFVSTVSHELRTPLTAIDMATRMLRIVLDEQEVVLTNSAPVAAKVNKYLDILQEQCREERDLIADLLDLQRLNTNAYELELNEVELQTWLKDITSGLRERAEQQGQSFAIDVNPDLPVFVTDAMVLRRIISELLNNACKYTPEGEQIQLTVRNTTSASSIANAREASPYLDRHIEILVANTGIEIPPKERDRVFLPFYRAVNDDRWSKRGTGLGLNMVHKFVTLLNGTIELNSSSNKTCFQIELPPLGCMVNDSPYTAELER